ncbi:class I adenylate-forming enzyme family protein [Actinoplanes sichuanensis]|uniref:Class I adenylate-forming enzyme family protein n=1 Tax=Actinoplanes sichuanensis TaxID=512349 RepID=A0ABW4AIR9_9ACTN|nr:AMP-binding protein [Actinoplanes sichuanensis]BEL03751.1 class I adenylate-forming enzyme family protein [Actinoplanes sichuanensis]
MTGPQTWGDGIGTEAVRGVLMRTYTDRPRQVATLLDMADRWGQRPHVVQGDVVLTFAQLRHAARVKATELARRVGPGDRVVMIGFNSQDWIINFWATVTVGAVPVLGNAWWSPADVAECLTTVGPALVLADSRASRHLPPGAPTGRWSCDLAADTTPFAPPSGAAACDEDAPAALVFTSGTEGRPKAVVLSHRSLLAGLHMLLHVTKRLPHQVDDNTGDAGLHTGPMFHIGGIQTLLRAIVVGDTLVMPTGKFEPAEVLRLIEQWRIARWSAVPTMVSRVLEHPDRNRRDLSSLRSVTVGGAPVHAEFLAQLRGGLPGVDPRVATGWGLTENGGQATAASGRDTRDRPGSCGRPLPLVEIRIAEADGEILVRSPTQMIGYFGVDTSPIDGQGWLHTGDLGHVDDDGYLWITGRAKDMIIRGGENIAPAAVEQALAALPGVIEAAVFGVPSTDLGEEVMAVVVVEPGRTEQELVDSLRGRIASFAMPSRWRLQHETLPTTHSGKIDKSGLAAQARADLAAAGEKQ